MTHFQDGVWVGAAGTWADTSGIAPLPNTSIPSGVAYGVPVIGSALWNIVPATSVNNALATAQTVSGAAFTLAAGTSITATTVSIAGRGSVSLYKLDVPRCIAFSGAATSVTATIYTVSGYDYRLQPMDETISGLSGTGKAIGIKAFAYIEGATATGNTTSSVVFGTVDCFGAPYYFANFADLDIAWAGTKVSTSSGCTVAVTSTPTATSGDVRGTFSATPAADGSRAIYGYIRLPSPDNMQTVYGRTQYNA